ncbi:MAG: FimV/HubP family polar landmark protein [Alcaligenes aquatilis]|uniref:type IV pilus assembly protein FimV n=1 Tax=Alcaligenes aquatilis TaxID=323284 RepID=UPI002AA76822|nr:FimV/HubP family polar landmark protein [Alcaligenes faecalis]
MVGRLHPVRTLGSALLVAGMLAAAPVCALEIGHSRLVSAPNQVFKLDVGIRQISPEESLSLKVAPAPLSVWQQAGLTPPVDLNSLKTVIERDEQGQVRRIRLSSEQMFSGSVADVLLQIQSDSGQFLHQVSVLAPAPVAVKAVTQAQAGHQAPVSVQVSGSTTPSNVKAQSAVRVKSGDTLHALARRHAVDGVSAYQWMMAVHKQNPNAFIKQNMHRLKAGQTLQIPDVAAMLSIDDAQARRLYVDQAQALRSAAQEGQDQADASQGVAQTGSGEPGAQAQGQDRLLLSAGTQARDAKQQLQHQLRETGDRVSQLEENVSTLGRALQSQGEAAKDLILDSAQELGLGDAGSDAATGNTHSGASGAASSAAVAGAISAPSESEQGKMAGAVNKAKKTVSWIQEHMLAVMAVVLALIVVLVTWVLRRANTENRHGDDSPAPVSEAMVREKLEKINLDLDQPPSDEPPVRQ